MQACRNDCGRQCSRDLDAGLTLSALQDDTGGDALEGGNRLQSRISEIMDEPSLLFMVILL
jgi:hypothetical protein